MEKRRRVYQGVYVEQSRNTGYPPLEDTVVESSFTSLEVMTSYFYFQGRDMNQKRLWWGIPSFPRSKVGTPSPSDPRGAPKTTTRTTTPVSQRTSQTYLLPPITYIQKTERSGRERTRKLDLFCPKGTTKKKKKKKQIRLTTEAVVGQVLYTPFFLCS